MNAVPPTVTSMLRQSYANGTDLLLLFDYDGTLVPIVDDPRHARLSAEMRGTLRRLAQLPGVHLGIISGREHADLRDIVSIPELLLAGTAGLELDFRGITVTHPRVGTHLPLLKTLSEALRRLVERFPGGWVESKRVGITLHFRHVVASQVDGLRRLADSLLVPWIGRLHVVDGPLALEITPNVGWTKGTAVRMFHQNLRARSCFPVYAGDGPNDIDAFQSVIDHDGLAIGVGTDAPSVAQIRIHSVDALGEWLRCLSHSLSEQSFNRNP